MDDGPTETIASPARLRPAGWRRRLLLGSAVCILLVALGVFGTYRRQIVSYLTHRKGEPAASMPYVPFDPRPELHLAVAGDVGDSGRRLTATADAMAAIGATVPYDALLLLGDNVYPRGDPAKLPDTVFTPFAPVLDEGADLLAILGNHDAPNGAAQMAALGMPGRWWSREYADGEVLVVGLDSNDVGDQDQRAWLETTLRASKATWKIVALHHPPYSDGYQGSSLDARQAFGPLFAENGVQLVLSGHDHDYQRSVPIDGVTYVVTGAASGTRRTGEADFTAVSFSWHHYLDVAVYADRLVLRAVNQDQRVADEWTLTP